MTILLLIQYHVPYTTSVFLDDLTKTFVFIILKVGIVTTRDKFDFKQVTE